MWYKLYSPSDILDLVPFRSNFIIIVAAISFEYNYNDDMIPFSLCPLPCIRACMNAPPLAISYLLLSLLLCSEDVLA